MRSLAVRRGCTYVRTYTISSSPKLALLVRVQRTYAIAPLRRSLNPGKSVAQARCGARGVGPVIELRLVAAAIAGLQLGQVSRPRVPSPPGGSLGPAATARVHGVD